MRDWVRWHDDYERPGSSLSRRLQVVQGRLAEALASVGSRPVILSLCSGDGRDVIGVLAKTAHPVRRALLIESDPDLAARAAAAAAQARLGGVEIRCGDAGAVETFCDIGKVDVLLLCGIFGNIDHREVRTVVDLVPNFVRNGGYVIWTRGGSHPDRRPEIRQWFDSAGLEEIAFTGEPESFGVGLNRVTDRARPNPVVPERLFTFR